MTRFLVVSGKGRGAGLEAIVSGTSTTSASTILQPSLLYTVHKRLINGCLKVRARAGPVK